MKIAQRLAFYLLTATLCSALAGCAVETIPYPKLSSVKTLKNKILSREEQEDVIRNLSAEQQQHQSTAIQQIEKPE